MAEIEFHPWPATPRLFRDVVITEKIDGENGAIHIKKVEEPDFNEPWPLVRHKGEWYYVAAQTRKKLLSTAEMENSSFGRWVDFNAYELLKTLGVGTHFGEWWGKGIKRGYGLSHNVFSLFNTKRWAGLNKVISGNRLTVVPVLYTGPLTTVRVRIANSMLARSGSAAAPGFMSPEGVCIYQPASDRISKVTIENDSTGKWVSR